MTTPLLLIIIFFFLNHHLHAATLSAATSTVCGIVAGEPRRRIECYKNHQTILIQPPLSYDVVSGGDTFFCGLTSGGYILLCWDISTFTPKRLYFNYTYPLREISVGGDQVCGVINGTNMVKCWRAGSHHQTLTGNDGFQSISSGFNFSCGILLNNSRVRCWGINNSSLAEEIESQFGDIEMVSIVAGGMHVCGFNSTGFLVCKGSNSSGQLDFPVDQSSRIRNLALGFDYSCGIRESNGSVLCWGGSSYVSNLIQELKFETLIGGLDFTCGLLSLNLSVVCWGPGWIDHGPIGVDLPLPKMLPGSCVQSNCDSCGVFPESQSLCSDSGNICNSCVYTIPTFPQLTPSFPPLSSPPQPKSKRLTRKLFAFAIVGSVGSFIGICSIMYCLYTGICLRRKQIHNSVQPTVTRGGSSTSRASSNGPPSRSLTIRRQGSRIMRRQRSGTSSTKHERAEEFSFQELEDATNNFSWENKIGSGSFGVVYKGKLSDGREVAIKRSETGPRTKKLQEKESAFESELSFLSRLHHKHLVRLVGYCDERHEMLLVYEYMKHGALYDHLHNKNSDKHYNVVNSWKMRIKIALDSARGIEYLHNYAVPPIIHRDIKSSNILLDDNLTGRVSDFGLSLMGPEKDVDVKPLNAAGTIGYIDPEYYGMNVLTPKSDVYGFGVVLLELLTGKKAIFKGERDGGEPMTVVDFACPKIMSGELGMILDPRVGPPESSESEAVELVSYTALHCVNLEGKDRPSMSDIVANLERALALCVDNHTNTSGTDIFIESD